MIRSDLILARARVQLLEEGTDFVHVESLPTEGGGSMPNDSVGNSLRILGINGLSFQGFLPSGFIPKSPFLGLSASLSREVGSYVLDIAAALFRR